MPKEVNVRMTYRWDGKEQKSLVDNITDQIIQLILDRNMQPGDRLPTEVELTQHLGVGRSTVREAVRRLASRNILEVRQGSGTFVSGKKGVPEDPFGLTFIGSGPKVALELSDVRLMLEPELAATAAIRATQEQLELLSELCKKVEARILAEEDYIEDDIAFHRCIAEISGNSVLQNIIPVISSSVNISVQETEDEFRHFTLDEHRRIVAAIARRDAIGARFAMATHLNTSRDCFAQKVFESSL